MNDLIANPEYAGKIAELKKALEQQRAAFDDPVDFDDPATWTSYAQKYVWKKKCGH